MERNNRTDDIILLFDNYGQDSRSLRESFRQAGYDCPAVVIEDDGFLPDGITSVYGHFLGDFKETRGKEARPRYFNEITVPDYWEISGTNNGGKVHDLYRERGRIFYAEPLHKRLVKVVDWCDENGIVRSSDHYNRCGALYARTVFNKKGQRVNKTWFSASGQEIIMENYITDNVILNEEGKVKIFSSKVEFIVYFMEKTGIGARRIFYNSLSTPLFVSEKLPSYSKRDVLFWQEPVGDEIPGNMKIILSGKAKRTNQIMVQKKHAYDRLLALGAQKDMLRKLGFVYPFQRENQHRPQALICTNSDQIEHCRELVEALPRMHFYIAALTEMSSKLMRMGGYENVSLYPNVRMDVLETLFEKCDYYFDINHMAEIVSSVRQAFLHNQLIFAFQETIHNRDYVAAEHVYPAANAKQMITDVKAILEDAKLLKEHLKKQHEAAAAEEAEAYMEI